MHFNGFRALGFIVRNAKARGDPFPAILHEASPSAKTNINISPLDIASLPNSLASKLF